MYMHESTPAAKILQATHGEESQLADRLDEYSAFRLISKVEGLPFLSGEIPREEMDGLIRTEFPGLIAVEGYSHGQGCDFWETL